MANSIGCVGRAVTKQFNDMQTSIIRNNGINSYYVEYTINVRFSEAFHRFFTQGSCTRIAREALLHKTSNI